MPLKRVDCMEHKLYFHEAVPTLHKRTMERADWARISALLRAPLRGLEPVT